MSSFSTHAVFSVLTLVILQSASVLSGKIDVDATKELSDQKKRDWCYDYDNGSYTTCPGEGLAVGIIIAIIVSIVIFFAIIIIGICFCCACCCFAGRRARGGEVHTHVVYPPQNGQNGAYPQQGGPPSYVSGPYPAQQYPNQGYYGNAGTNPAHGTPNNMRPQQ